MSLAARGKAIATAAQKSWLGQLVSRFGKDRADVLAAVIAFNLLFSTFPIILGVLAIVGLIVRDNEARDVALNIVLSAVPMEGAASVLEVLNDASQSAGLIGVLSFVGLLWAGSGLFDALEVSFGQIYGVPTRSFIRGKLMALVMMLLFSLLVVAEMVATIAVGLVGHDAVSWPFVAPQVAVALSVAGGAISLLAAFALCFAIYFVVPNVRLAPRQILPGTAFTSLALVLLTQIFPLYAFYLGGFNRYGAIFGLFFLLMTWSYLVASALMVGAELNVMSRPVAAKEKQSTGQA
ncbi:MAG: YihY/virulence factor BrkB family protein [Dehalococcoidia bacterium]|nr:YihY/virulence factor BrkB family protein [Dehalococcoidia bacterium]